MRLAAALVLLVSAPGGATSPRTFRVDYFHTGSSGKEIFSLDRLVVEPLPWPGNPARPIDDTDSGKYRFLVRDAANKSLLYSRGFSSIFGEWEETQDAKDRTVSDAAPDSPGPLIPLLKNGPPESKVDLLILGDGYTRAQRSKFEK